MPSVPRTSGRDFVDRGKNGLECICLLLAYKIKYPENFFLLRGNHECASINRIYGFYDECKRRYNIKLWKKFQDVFNVLPFAAVVDEKIFCIHAGLSPDLNSPEQIKRIMRPTDVPDSGLLCDLLWSDPEADISGWAENDRGVSYTFGEDVVSKFLQKHDYDLIVRAHQVVEDGYEFFADRQLVTHLLGPQLLRRVRQRRRRHGGRREPHVLLPHPQAGGEAEGALRWQLAAADAAPQALSKRRWAPTYGGGGGRAAQTSRHGVCAMYSRIAAPCRKGGAAALKSL